jgi:hypothetical protein
MAPTIYITGNPGRTEAVTRNFGRAVGALTAVNPYTGHADHITAALADPVAMKTLHMITAGTFAMETLAASTRAIESGSPGDATYSELEGRIEALTTRRWRHRSGRLSMRRRQAMPR